MSSYLFSRVAAVLALGVLAGCGGGGATGTTGAPEDVGLPPGMGKVNFAVTDAPFPAAADCLAAAMVEIDEVRLKGRHGWVDLAVDGGSAMIDLFQLRSGLADLLATGVVPADKYRDVRLHVVRSVLVFSDGSPDREFRIRGHSDRIDVRIRPAVRLESGKTIDLLLDIDLAGSFKVRGLGCSPDCDDLKSGEGRVIFYPRIRAHQVPGTATPSDGSTSGGETGGDSGGGDAGGDTGGGDAGGDEGGDDESVIAGVSGTVLDASGAPTGAVLIMVYPTGFVFDGVTEPTAATISASAGGVAAEGSYALGLEAGTWDIFVQAVGANEPTVAVTITLSSGEVVTQDLALP